MFDFSGRRVLVTGASRGIAAEIVRGFCRSGAEVALHYCARLDAKAGFPTAAEALSDEMAATGARVSLIDLDLASPAAGAELGRRAQDALGAVDIVVSSASAQINKPFAQISEADTALQVQVNLTAPLQLFQAVLPGMCARGFGRIVTIGSVQEVSPSAEMAVYAMTKAAQENLVRNLAVTCARQGVTVNNVSPGLIATDRNAFRRADAAGWDAMVRSANPMGRAGLPADVAPAVLYLASDDAAFVTGTTIYVSGGAHLPVRIRDLQRD